MSSQVKVLSNMAIGCLSNDRNLLGANLMASPVIKSDGLQLIVEENPTSAAKGYNNILRKSDKPILILAHHDVYLPSGWERLLAKRISEVEAVDPNWGVIAAFGIDKFSNDWGPVWSTSIGRIVGQVPILPVPIRSADELLLVVRHTGALVFDEDLPHFHFYGLDIVQTSLSAGMGAWSVALPLIHNDMFKGRLDKGYDEAYHYVRKKWRAVLPITAPTVEVAWHGLHLLREKRRMKVSFNDREDVAAAARADPVTLAERCGWKALEY